MFSSLFLFSVLYLLPSSTQPWFLYASPWVHCGQMKEASSIWEVSKVHQFFGYLWSINVTGCLTKLFSFFFPCRNVGFWSHGTACFSFLKYFHALLLSLPGKQSVFVMFASTFKLMEAQVMNYMDHQISFHYLANQKIANYFIMS